MGKFEEQLERIYASDRQTWRRWLQENHLQAMGVWLVHYKVSSAKPSVKYSEAVKEALCFGWIDSKVKTLDEERYMQIFTPRKPKSVWSKLNKQYVEELDSQGLIAAAGWKTIEIARQNGSWTSLDAIEALIIPSDLQHALEANREAEKNFANFSKTTKKNILYWIDTAKRSETRLKRIEKTVIASAANQNPLAIRYSLVVINPKSLPLPA